MLLYNSSKAFKLSPSLEFQEKPALDTTAVSITPKYTQQQLKQNNANPGKQAQAAFDSGKSSQLNRVPAAKYSRMTVYHTAILTQTTSSTIGHVKGPISGKKRNT